PRFIIESIFCIQFSPVMRTSFLTSGKSPQNVKKIVVSFPIAAPVVARISVGQILSSSPLQAKIVSLSWTCGFGAATSVLSSISTLMSHLLLLQHEAVHAVLRVALDKGVPRRLRPRLEVRH